MTTATRPNCLATGLPELGIYVACLASYNNGGLYGSWLDLAKVGSVEELQEAIDWMLAQSPAPGAEEYAIHDATGLPGFLAGEWPDLGELVRYAQASQELGLSDPIIYRLACQHAGQVLLEKHFEDMDRGLWDNPSNFARDFYEEISNLDELSPLAAYIDWEQVWRSEFEMDGWSAQFIPNLGGYQVFAPL
jgi:antirestriction protein